MRIQNLAIIFIIIILPISLVISTYSQYQIQTINTQTLYDSKLTSATYDAIRAFQINSVNSNTSELTNSKMRDLEASVSTFRNSIKTTFSLSGYSEDTLDRYVPALVYTLYDGFYIYSPYKNIVNDDGTVKNDVGDGQYGFKPYISYSCRYVYPSLNNPSIDVVITYALDNHISVQGIINNEYVNKDGYLIDNIKYDETNNNVTYNGIEIQTENVKQYLPLGQGDDIYDCIKLNGTTYYLDSTKERVIARLNDTTLTVQCSKSKNKDEFEKWEEIIKNNALAKDYYIDAYNFTKWVKSSGLQDLTYANAYDNIMNDDGNIVDNQQLWNDDRSTKKIFDFNTSSVNYSENIENESSNFNEHRLEIIRHKIEINLAIAISNYNSYLGVNNVFQMPKLDEEEWYNITHNIALISFVQGLSIGGKVYNGYSLVTNSESKEVVLENNIYILGQNTDGRKQYYKIGDRGITDGTVKVTAGGYSSNGNAQSAGRINLDFERGMLINNDATKTYYYYPLKDNDASYNSVIMQKNVETYDDIYAYVNQQNDDLKIAFYTALGRERASTYKIGQDYVKIESGTDSGNSGEEVNPVKQCKIIYKIDGNAVYEDTVNEGESYTLRSKITQQGKLLKNWSDGTNTYRPGEIINKVSSDMVLSATYELLGDCNGDGKVDETDYNELEYWLSKGYGIDNERADINQDGNVDWEDLELLRKMIGRYQITYKVDNSIVDTAYTVNGQFRVRGAVEKDGQTFLGWSDGINIYIQGDYENVSEDTILNAVYEPIPEAPVYLGDINIDGQITEADLRLLEMYLVRGYSFTEEQQKRADLNQDGNITWSDYDALRTLIFGN